MKKSLFAKFAGAVVLTLAASSASAVSITSNAGTTYDTDALAGFATTGADQDGMTVSVFFADGSSETVSWQTTGASTGGAFSSGWSITLAGDSFNVPFVFTNTGNPITGFSMDGSTGVGTIFDIVSSPFLSPGSASGKPFQLSGSRPAGLGTIEVEYTNELSVGGTFYGDLFTKMNVNFTGQLGTEQVLRFVTDTDNSAFDSVIVPTDPIPVPEPGALLLLGAGLFGLVAARRRKAG